MVFSVQRTSLAYEKWDGEGKNTKPCEQARQIGATWIVDLPNIIDLMAFIDTEGKIIISETKDPIRYNIEIYDEWRE